MRISNFYIENFRNIRKADIDFGRINIFTGKNASGKSNFLLALSHCLRTKPDFSMDFSDNIVTYGQGISKTVFRTTLSDIHQITIVYRGNEASYFAPTKFVFENNIAKRINASLGHKLYYSGDISILCGDKNDVFHAASRGQLKKFQQSSHFKTLDNELVYERCFDDEIATTKEGNQVIQKTEKNKSDHQLDYYREFDSHKCAIHPWNSVKEFSSSAIYQYVIESYDSEIYESVMERLKKSYRGYHHYADFAKARFIHLLADVQRDAKQFDCFSRDLARYTDGIIKRVYINQNGSKGPKGEIWINSPNCPHDLSSISAGTAVMLYFILLKNWIRLSHQSFRQPDVMLFDEVDSIIHPSLMVAFQEIVKDVSKGIQLFIATHSPLFIDCFAKEDVYWLKDVTMDLNTKQTHSSIYSYRDIIGRVSKQNRKFLEEEENSTLFIEGLLDSIFPHND